MVKETNLNAFIGDREMKIVKGNREFEVIYEDGLIIVEGELRQEVKLLGPILECVGAKVLNGQPGGLSITDEQEKEIKAMMPKKEIEKQEYCEFATLSPIEREEKAFKMKTYLEKIQGYRMSEDD